MKHELENAAYTAGATGNTEIMIIPVDPSVEFISITGTPDYRSSLSLERRILHYEEDANVIKDLLSVLHTALIWHGEQLQWPYEYSTITRTLDTRLRILIDELEKLWQVVTERDMEG